MENTNLASAHKPVKVLDGVVMLIVCAVIVVALYVLGLTGAFSNNTMRYLFKIFLYITMGSMWNLMSGFTGMTSLGQQVFVGIAGYSVAVMTTTYKMSFWMGILGGPVIAVIFALLLSFVLFRMEGMYFAVATWLVSEAVRTWFTSWKYVNQGGGMTVRTSQIPKIGSLYILALTLCVISVVVIFLLLRTKTGLGLTAMRDDASAASAVGVNIFKSKLLCYIICSLFIAIAGGIGTVSGPIVGAVIYVLLDEFLSHYPGWSNIILGAIAILVILFLPSGIMGTLQKKLHFEIFSQKRFSEPKKKRRDKKQAEAA